MRSIANSRFLFAFTVLATLSMISTEAFARGGRGGGGGGRGGRSAASSRGRSAPSQHAPSQHSAGTRAGNASPGSRTGQFSGQAGNLSSGLANNSQFQGMLQQQAGQASGKFSQQQGQFQQNAQSKLQNGQFQQNAQTKANEFKSGSQPFSPAWYAEHPNAWQATHPHADAAVVASAAAVTAWVGGAYYNTGGTGSTVVYETAPVEAISEETAPESSLATSPNDAAPTPATAAEAWFPVGTYSLATTKNAPALLMVQLVVDHQGTLRGVYYDAVTNTTHNLVGTLDTNTQIAQWQLESNSQVTFQAPLNELTQAAGNVKVNLPNGPQQWLLSRIN